MKTLLLLSTILLLASQCTVQKRLYTKGWHVERNPGHTNRLPQTTADNPDELPSETADNRLAETKQPQSYALPGEKPAPEANDELLSGEPSDEDLKQLVPEELTPKDTIYIRDSKALLPKPPAAKVAFVTGVSSILLGVIACMFFVLGAAASSSALWVVGGVAIGIMSALILATLLAGIIAVVQYKNNKEKYSDKFGLGWFFLGVVTLLIAGLVALISMGPFY